MFGGKKTANTPSDQVETVIGKDTCFKGTLSTKGSVRIDGCFEGEIAAAGDIVVGETGQVRAQVKARNALIAGLITGDCEITGKLELLPSGKLFGDIKVGKLIVDEGAIFKGGCEMRPSEEAAATKTKTT